MQLPGKADWYLGYCEGVVGNFHGDAVRFHGRLKKPVLTKRQSVASLISRPSSAQSAITVAARDVPSPATSFRREAPSPAVASLRGSDSPLVASPRDLPSPRKSYSPIINVTRHSSSSIIVHEATPPEISAPAMAPSISSTSFTAVPISPELSPHPERSMSHESQDTSRSSIPPITPADDRHDGAAIALQVDEPEVSSPLLPPIRVSEIAKQLSTDSPIEHSDSPDPTTSRFPLGERPISRDSSVYSDESNPRVSVALSDNGVGNIGLSLLQNFVEGDGGNSSDDSDDEGQFAALRRVQSPESTHELDAPLPTPGSALSVSQYSQSPQSATQPLPSDPPLTSRSERSESVYSESPRSADIPLPPPGVRPESEYEFGDWEGADDIYDQYRYSRYSMASRMSRFSRASMHTAGSSWSSNAPPVPTDRPSVESTRERKESKGKLPSRLAESTTSEDVQPTPPDSATDAAAGASSPSKMQKNRPAPLTFKHEPEPSPLLHATFGSPQASPTAPSATSAAFASPTLVSPVYPTNTGAATSLRKRLENVDGSEDGSGSSDGPEHGDGQELSVSARDENIPNTAVSQAAEIVNGHLPAQSIPPTPALPSPSPRQQPESSAVLEKRILALANAEPPADQPPPPPYSATAIPGLDRAGPSSSQVPPPAPATSPPPGNPVVIPPPNHPQARPIDPNRAAVPPHMRESLFMPHPGAPKPAAAPMGPMYGRQPMHPPPMPANFGPPPGSIHHVLGMAFQARREGRPAPPTIYGRFEFDLSHSMGPVPISFSTEPQNNVPANRPRPPMPWTPPLPPSRTGTPASTLSADLASRRNMDPTGRANATSPPLRGNAASPPLRGPSPAQIDQVLAGAGPGPRHPPPRSLTLPPPLRGPSPAQGAPPGPGPIPPAMSPPPGPNQPIARTNFTPRVHQSRPRSRSFSAMTSGDMSIRTEALAGSRDDSAPAMKSPELQSPPLSPIRPLQIATKRSKSATATTTIPPRTWPRLSGRRFRTRRRSCV
ncbi:hypothetical protein C8Q80DRAFT_124417 [Daedaleopsis nitida]|nr:hypothetical protein C8Q80DRAFT_124417 [Daedaleopsis nitida]